MIVEQQNRELVRRLADMNDLLQRALNQVQLAAGGGGSGGGGGGGAFFCNATPAIAGGGSGTGNVYLLSGGSPVLVASGATIYNNYLSATTAGRVCTLCQNNDGTFMVYGQSCT